ncbi:MAG: DUF447 family protein [Pirellulaceae bacterium]|nr:DUF447 family protein [Pirellulaceae bacterium]
MIIEGLITCAASGATTPHVAALGPVVDVQLAQWTLRPFQSSRVFSTLRQSSTCVFHVIDDALAIVQLVLGETPELSFRRTALGGWIIEQACHWYELEIIAWDVAQPRSEATARLVGSGDLRPFWGWNRAKHALLEAAILISRESLIPAQQLDQQLDALTSAIEKTAGPQERRAWDLIENWRHQRATRPE